MARDREVSSFLLRPMSCLVPQTIPAFFQAMSKGHDTWALPSTARLRATSEPCIIRSILRERIPAGDWDKQPKPAILQQRFRLNQQRLEQRLSQTMTPTPIPSLVCTEQDVTPIHDNRLLCGRAKRWLLICLNQPLALHYAANFLKGSGDVPVRKSDLS